MLFEDCVNEFPIKKTIVGYYELDHTFTISSKLDIEKIDKYDDSPLEWRDDYAFPFVIYNGFTNVFENWYFSGFPIKGYINPSGIVDDFYPAINSPEFGWEIINMNGPYHDAEIMFPDFELYEKLAYIKRCSLNELSEHDWMNEQVAYLFDKQKYEAGYVFTNYDELKKFINENF